MNKYDELTDNLNDSISVVDKMSRGEPVNLVELSNTKLFMRTMYEECIRLKDTISRILDEDAIQPYIRKT